MRCLAFDLDLAAWERCLKFLGIQSRSLGLFLPLVFAVLPILQSCPYSHSLQVGEVLHDLACSTKVASRPSITQESFFHGQQPPGVPLSAASWFLMRLPFEEVLCEAGDRDGAAAAIKLCPRSFSTHAFMACLQGRVKVCRLQRRLIHLLSQSGESHLDSSLQTMIPKPSARDEFHPARVQLV